MKTISKVINVLSLCILSGSILSNITPVEKLMIFKVLGYVMMWALAIMLIWRRDDFSVFGVMLSIYVLSLSSMLNVSMISQYPYGVDVCKEYYVSMEVLMRSFWQPSNDVYFSVSTLVFTIPMLSIITGINLMLIYKFVLVLVIALIAPILYQIYTLLGFAKETRVLALLFIISSLGYGGLTGGLRESISYFQFYIALWLILKFTLKEAWTSRTQLALILLLVGFGIMHYAFLYIVLTILIISMLISFLIDLLFVRIHLHTYIKYQPIRILSSTIILLFIIRFLWDYINVANIKAALDIMLKAINEMFQPTNQLHASLVASISPQSDMVSVILTWSLNVLRILMMIGVVHYVIHYVISKEDKNTHKRMAFYPFICLSSILILMVTFLNRALGWAVEASRVYYFTVFLIAPFFHYGALFLAKLIKLAFHALSRRPKIGNISKKLDKALLILVVLSITSPWLYSPLSTIFGLSADYRILTPYTVSPSKEALVMVRNYIDVEEIASAKWINTYGYSLKRVITDFHGRSRLWIAHIPLDKIVVVPGDVKALNEDIMYLRRDNFVFGYITIVKTLGLVDYTPIGFVWGTCSLIYSNGRSGVIYSIRNSLHS